MPRLRSPLLLLLAVSASLSASCTRPTVEVCRSLGESGRCVGRTAQLSPGRSYVVRVSGFGLPEREAEIRLLTLEGRSGDPVLATRPLRRVEGKPYLENPLTLPRPGRYRIEVRGGGQLFASTEVSAPRPSFWVVDGGTGVPIPTIRGTPPPVGIHPLMPIRQPSR